MHRPHPTKHIPTELAFGSNLSRRGFLSAAIATLGCASLAAHAGELKKRPKVAAVFTTMTYRSHAHVLLENFLEPYLFNGKRTDPGVDITSFYADQTQDGDMLREVARQYDIPIYKTIEGAVALGGKKLAVDAVLSIGEHGKLSTQRTRSAYVTHGSGSLTRS